MTWHAAGQIQVALHSCCLDQIPKISSKHSFPVSRYLSIGMESGWDSEVQMFASRWIGYQAKGSLERGIKVTAYRVSVEKIVCYALIHLKSNHLLPGFNQYHQVWYQGGRALIAWCSPTVDTCGDLIEKRVPIILAIASRGITSYPWIVQFLLFSLQKGKHIETVTAVIDLKNLSEKHLYWPVVDQFKKVRSYCSVIESQQ